jgi:hypothetical protein
MNFELAATGTSAEVQEATTVIPNTSWAAPPPDTALYAVTVIEPAAEAVSVFALSTEPVELTVFASKDTELVAAAVHVAGPEITKEPVPLVVELNVRAAPT